MSSAEASSPPVLVDGAGGLLGRRVVRELRARGRRVRATDLAGAALPDGDGIERVYRNLAVGPLDDLLEGVEEVVHVAGRFDLGLARRELDPANVHAAARLARRAARHRVKRFVHVSSVTVYGRPRVVPADERTPMRPGNPYERSKAAGERAVREVAERADLPLLVVRPSGIYGPESRYGVALLASAFALAAATGRPSGVRAFRGGPAMTHVHVDDVAGAIAHLLERDDAGTGVYNVADATPLPWGDLLEAFEGWLGVDNGRPVPLSRRRARWMARAWRWMPDGRRARINAALGRRWDRLVAEQGLVPALRPRYDRYAYDYWLADHVYDAGALRDAGYALRWPDPLAGMRETLRWYEAERWLPPGCLGGTAAP